MSHLEICMTDIIGPTSLHAGLMFLAEASSRLFDKECFQRVLFLLKHQLFYINNVENFLQDELFLFILVTI